MKKAAIIMQQKDAETGVGALRSLGVVHVEHQQIPKGKDINLIREDLTLVKHALEIISQEESFAKCKVKDEKVLLADWRQTARHIIDLWKRLDHLEEYSRALTQQINDWREWGDFDPQGIRDLAENNIYVRLYRIPKKELHKIPKDVIVEKISEREGIVYCAIFSQERIDIGFKELELPKFSLNSMQKRLLEDKRVTDQIRLELNKHLSYRCALAERKEYLERELEFHEAINGMAKEETLTYLVGYVPAENEEQLVGLARKEKWGILITEPSQEDSVPTLIRNPRWIALVSPIFKFLEILPGYRELDISLPFLIFFSIFFGILIGDAGYGIVYALITFMFQRRSKRRNVDTSRFFLFYILSLSAVVWGALTGTFFGQEWVLKAGYKPLIPALTDERGIQRFCFFLGALHLSIAHAWRGILKAPSLNALGDLGSICVLWAVFFIAKTLILGDAVPSFCSWFFISGATLIIIFTNPQKNIFKFAEEWIAWLITLPFSFIGNFADVVSYIRLFAVGMAGVAIADAFNAMAAMVGRGDIFMMLLAAFIALIGNALSIVLGPVSVLVHGVRLNLLEFSGHVGLSWSGTAYKPLKE